MNSEKTIHELAFIIGGLSRLAVEIQPGASRLSDFGYYVVEAINLFSEEMLSKSETEEKKEKAKAEFNQTEVDTLTTKLSDLRHSVPTSFPGATGLYDIANTAVDSGNPFHLRAAIAGIEAVLKAEAGKVAA